MSPLQPHNSALLASEGGNLGEKCVLSGTHSEREACCFCTADGHLVALPPCSPLLLLLSLSLSLSAPPLSAVLPGNGGLEQ